MNLYADLGWLPRPPADFRRRCREALEPGRNAAQALVRLSAYALGETQLQRLARAFAEAKDAGCDLGELTALRLGIVGNATLEPLDAALTATGLRHGLALECVRAEYGQAMQEALAPESRINAAKPDVVLLALDYRGLPAASALEALAEVRTLREGFRAGAGAPCIVQTLAPPPEALFGSLDRVLDHTLRASIASFNAGLAASIAGTPDLLLDVAALAETVGLAEWHSPTQWNVAKLPFDAQFLPLYADHVCRVLAALRGKSRRCLILDLDNTLWGGTIGDAGLEGIVLGQGDATGEAYLEVQRTALALRERGIVLAVSSKNEDAVARSAFRDHPDMLLREEHVAVFQANWDDKATNVVAIARALSLGLDAMVFLDDNPAERALVREALPAVAVPELPEDPALYARTLCAAGYFEAIAFSDEDRRRAGLYQENAVRAALAERVADLDAYLASLAMRIEFRPFDAPGRARIAQLVNKSNQFNLTTRRYTELEIAALERDPSVFGLQVRLHDRFGDNGMISVIVARAADDGAWEIDTWLMSCRVLGRRIEQMVLRELVRQARERGIRRLIGVYRPTPKNAMVRDHYEGLGFRALAQAPAGETRWEFAVDGALPEEAPMAVDRSAFDLSPA